MARNRFANPQRSLDIWHLMRDGRERTIGDIATALKDDRNLVGNATWRLARAGELSREEVHKVVVYRYNH